jgi:archaetidylinositol phosphate synthase
MRPFFERAVGRVMPLLLSVSSNPNHYSFAGALLSVMAAAAAYAGSALAAAGLVALSGLMDAIDGAVARASGRASPAGRVLDASLDRVSDTMYHLALLYAGAEPSLVVASLGGSLLVPYIRARGEVEGVSLAGVGVAERGERVLIVIGGLAGAGVAGAWAATAATGVLALLSWLTAAERLARLLSSLSPAKV